MLNNVLQTSAAADQYFFENAVLNAARTQTDP